MKSASALVCLGPDAFEVRSVPRPDPRRDQIEVAVEAASVNPIDVRRAGGYGARLLSLVGAGKLPLVLGNDFAGTVSAIGRDVASFKVGDKVFGVKPTSAFGTHATHAVVKAAHACLAPADRDLPSLAVLPYSFITMWLAATGAGLTRDHASGKTVLVHGAGGGLGLLALQLLSSWGVRATAITWPNAAADCLAAGAVETRDCMSEPFRGLAGRFDATLNFATWDDDAALLSCLREGACGHATTVHPLLSNLDRLGWLRGATTSFADRRRQRARLPRGVTRYAWTLFRPAAEALAELRTRADRLSLPIGCHSTLPNGRTAFEHVRSGKPGRALLHLGQGTAPSP